MVEETMIMNNKVDSGATSQLKGPWFSPLLYCMEIHTDVLLWVSSSVPESCWKLPLGVNERSNVSVHGLPSHAGFIPTSRSEIRG